MSDVFFPPARSPFPLRRSVERQASYGEIRRQPSMARDAKNERGKIGTGVNELQRGEGAEVKEGWQARLSK